MNRGRELLGQRVRPHLRSTRRVFNSKRCHLRTQKAPKLLAALGELTSLSRPGSTVADPPQSPTPLSALRASSFSPSAYHDAIESLPLSYRCQSTATVELGRLGALLRHWVTRISSAIFARSTPLIFNGEWRDMQCAAAISIPYVIF